MFINSKLVPKIPQLLFVDDTAAVHRGHIRVQRWKVLFCVFAMKEGGKFFTRPYIPRPPRASYIRWGEGGGSRPQKGQNTAYSGRPLYVGQCRESPCLPVTEYAQRI